jgi:hypothetical protein
MVALCPLAWHITDLDRRQTLTKMLHPSPRIISFVAALAATGALCACGGDGGSAGGAPRNLQSAPSPSLPIYIAGSTLKATDSSGNIWTATYSSTAAGTTMYSGQVAYENPYFFTAQMNATVIDSESGTKFALANPYSPLGLVESFSTLPGRISGGAITSYNPLPSTLMAGESGPFITGNLGSSSYPYTETYSVTENNPTALFLNIHSVFPDFGTSHGENSLTGLYSGDSIITYAVTSSGAATLAKIQVTINGTTLTFE